MASRMSGKSSRHVSPLDSLVARAQELIATKRLSDALRLIDAAETLLQTEPDSDGTAASASANLTLYRALVLQDIGRTDAALAAASALIDCAELSESNMAQRDAILMRCCVAQRKWRKATDYAESLLVLSDDNLAVEAFCALGRINLVAWNRPEAAATFFQQALQRDPLCTQAWDAIIEHWLLTPEAQKHLLSTLAFPEWSSAVHDTYHAFIALLPSEAKAHDLIEVMVADPISPSTPRYLQHYITARRAYLRNAPREALGEVNAALNEKPQDVHCIALKLVLLVDLRATNDLFEFAHRVVDSLRPSPALASYAVGCYYYSVALFDKAGRYFSKTTQLDPLFAAGWIALGHCYARLEEGELALNSYRRAQAQFPGLIVARTLIGLQHMRSNNGALAACFLQESNALEPNDPLTLNEMGVMAMKSDRDLDAALAYFKEAYQALPNRQQPSEYHDCIIFNLATVLRRVGQLNKALDHFLTYVRLRPYAVAAHTGLGLTYHLMGNLRAAIKCYHTALGIKADSTTRDLLEKALEEEMDKPAVTVGTAAHVGHSSALSQESSDWLDAELQPHGHRGYARPAGSPSAQSPLHFSLSAISRIARSESQAPAMGDGPTPTRTTINRSLTF